MRKSVAVICLMFLFGLSYAGLSVDPAVINISAQPGASYEGKYTVKNTYDYPITIAVNTKDWNSFSGNGELDINKWLKFPKDRYLISSNESMEVPYKIKIDNDFKGSVSGRVYFSVEQEEGQMISISISVPIYVTVQGTEHIDFAVDSLDLYGAQDGINYKMVLENKGNIHIRHSGVIEIYNKNKKKLIKTVPILETVPTYCGQKRDFAEKLTGAGELKKGKYTAVFKITALNKEVLKEIKFKVSKLGEVATN